VKLKCASVALQIDNNKPCIKIYRNLLTKFISALYVITEPEKYIVIPIYITVR